jgi:hypothetical protein
MNCTYCGRPPATREIAETHRDDCACVICASLCWIAFGHNVCTPAIIAARCTCSTAPGESDYIRHRDCPKHGDPRQSMNRIKVTIDGPPGVGKTRLATLIMDAILHNSRAWENFAVIIDEDGYVVAKTDGDGEHEITISTRQQ